jgi:hypothetical protein
MPTVNTTTNPEDWTNRQPAYVTGAAAAGTANVTLVTLTVKDILGRIGPRVRNIMVYLSDSATGVGLTAITASGAVAAGASGIDLGDLTAKKSKLVQTTAAGVYILSITDTAKTAFVVCVDLGNGQSPLIVLTLATGNYG